MSVRQAPPARPSVLVDHLFRTRAARLVAWLTRVFGAAHLELAEEVVQDALLKALQQWPRAGIPDNPEAWLFRVARNGALDAVRRHAVLRARAAEIAADIQRTAASGDPMPPGVEDDELRLVFLCCHPALPRDARVALSLKVCAGFSVREIARAFLCGDAAIAQRLVRAKRLLRDNAIELELDAAGDLGLRVDSVLEVIYLLFNEGYSAHAGDDLVRLDLCGEALRLGQLTAASPVAGTPAAHALVALMALQAARLPARADEGGEIVLLDEQDRSLWDRRLLALGFAHLEKSASGPRMTEYHVQAAIAALHARASSASGTAWPEILALYDDLLRLNLSPVVALNRAVALSKVAGPRAALAAIAAIEGEPALADYFLLPAAKGRLPDEAGDRIAAAGCYREALARRCSEPERRFVLRRLRECERARDPRPPAAR